MSDRAVDRASTEPVRSASIPPQSSADPESSAGSPTAPHLVERAPADAVEPALIQSGNPPRAFVKQDR